MANIEKNVERIRELGSPKAPAPVTGVPLGSLTVNLGAHVAEVAYKDFLHQSAERYQQDVEVAAATAKTPQEFITRVDSEITPKYKYNLFTKLSSKHRAIEESVPARYEMLKAREDKQVNNAASNILLNRMTDLRNRAPTFEQYESAANSLFKEHQGLYGAPGGELTLAFNEEKRNARQSYEDGEKRGLLTENARQMTNAFVESGGFTSSEEAINYITGPLKNSVYNPLNPSWQDIAKESLDMVMQNVPNHKMGLEILNSPEISSWLSNFDRKRLEAASLQSEINNNLHLVTEANKIKDATIEYLDSGRPYPGKLFDPELELRNQFNTEHDLLRMNDQQLLNLSNDYPQFVWPVIEARRKMFAEDPLKAAKRYFGESIDPIASPIVSEDQLMNERELLNSIADRVFKFNNIRTKNGEDFSIYNYFTDEETHKLSSAISKLSVNRQQDMSMKLLRLLKDSKHPAAVEAVGVLTGKGSLRALARLINDEPYAKERHNEIKRVSALYDNLAQNDPGELSTLQGFYSRFISEAKSPRGISVITSGLDASLKEDAGVWVIGHAMGAKDYESFKDKANNYMIFRTRAESLKGALDKYLYPGQGILPEKMVDKLGFALTDRLGQGSEDIIFGETGLLTLKGITDVLYGRSLRPTLADWAMQEFSYRQSQYAVTFLSAEDRDAFETAVSNKFIMFATPGMKDMVLEPQSLGDLERRGAIIFTDISFKEKGVATVDDYGAINPVIDPMTGKQITVSAVSPYTALSKGQPQRALEPTKQEYYVLESDAEPKPSLDTRINKALRGMWEPTDKDIEEASEKALEAQRKRPKKPIPKKKK